MTEERPVLSVTGASKVFAGTVALRHASLEVVPGEVHGLLGENGAGKSTFIKVLAGIHEADAGEICVDGVELARKHRPEDARAAGLAFIHQDLGLVADMSVAENIALAVGYRDGPGPIRWGAVRERARAVLDRMGTSLPPDVLVSELPIGVRAVVAIARSLAGNAKVLVLDEPTASLAAGEVETLFEILRKLCRDGVACVFVSHRMDEVYEICDRATVLRDGETVGTVPLPATPMPEVVRLIVGHELEPPSRLADAAAAAAAGDEARIVADELRGIAVGPLTFAARAGEIVGFTGLSDAGSAEVGKLLAGTSPVVAGRLGLDGREHAPKGPVDALRAGIAYVPANRAEEGLALDMTLRENLFLNPAVIGGVGAEGQVSRGRLIHPRRERASAQAILDRFDVRPPEPERIASTLSGGNAQKLMLARWLAIEPPVLVLNEPTTGVDIGAREEIYAMLRDAAGRGATCIVISSDFEEIAQLCHRAYVLWRGVLSRELAGADLTPAAVTDSALQFDRELQR